MRKTRKVILEHIYQKQTQRKFRYRQITPHRDNLTRDAELPYAYFDKDFLAQVLPEPGMGAPPILEITIQGIYPDADSGVEEVND